ncbi:hypothetical protein ACIBL6_06840 [Streptomyces sp. NPDC050400]|uniref:hypothetical protein n=1 Tax=Streptomyces sp. NPDC050400 TaxID=3365610 RepID=UPI0037A3233A
MMAHNRGYPLAAALGTALLITSVGACSSPVPEREYAVPNNLCGAQVSKTSLEPILPPGKKISEQPTSGVGVDRCRLQVDGEVVFSSSVETRAEDASAHDVAQSAIGVEPSDFATDNGRFIYAKTGAVGRVQCPPSPETEASLWVTARTTHPASAKDMLALIKDYAKGTAETNACAER